MGASGLAESSDVASGAGEPGMLTNLNPSGNKKRYTDKALPMKKNNLAKDFILDLVGE